MRKTQLLSALLSGAWTPGRPLTCYAASDYATGWDEVEGGTPADYNTYGEEDDVGAPAPLALRRAAPTRQAPTRQTPTRQAPPRQAPPRQAPPQQQYAPAGPTIAQVRAIVTEMLPTAAQIRAMLEAAISSRVPYGDVPPRPNADEAMFPMGLGGVTLTSLAPTGILSAQPQRAFRGERLVLAVQRSIGAAGVLATMTQFQIGDYKQLVGGGSMPVDVFAGDSFGVRLMLDASTPGVLYSIEVSAVVPPGEFIIVAGCVIGRAGEAAAR